MSSDTERRRAEGSHGLLRSERLKRVVDLLGATGLLVGSGPAMIAIAIAVRWRLGSPVFFSQERPGLHGKPFRMLKFRTMSERFGPDGAPLSDEQRLDSLGRFLRRTSLDELPELLHVLRGEMSLVGPRPLLMQYLERYSPRQARRHEVRPGITGWAQINGRNAISWEERLELDVEYVDRRDLWLDLMILLRTISTVLRREGIHAEGHATMPEFQGSGGAEDDVPNGSAPQQDLAS